MSKPTNGAARNTMSDFERQCYDWGWEDAEERITKLLEDPVVMSYWWSKVDKNLGMYGNLKAYVIALIKGEQK